MLMRKWGESLATIERKKSLIDCGVFLSWPIDERNCNNFANDVGEEWCVIKIDRSVIALIASKNFMMLAFIVWLICADLKSKRHIYHLIHNLWIIGRFVQADNLKNKIFWVKKSKLYNTFVITLKDSNFLNFYLDFNILKNQKHYFEVF